VQLKHVKARLNAAEQMTATVQAWMANVKQGSAK
jgi:hypothetical protein